MGFFDNVGNRLSGIGQNAVGKTQNFTEVMKLNSEISEMERKINVSYVEIGKIYYEKYAAESEDQEILRYIREIAANLQRIENLRAQICNIKGIVKCKNCGADMNINAVYCNHCGTKRIPDIMIQGNVILCPECGKEVLEGQIFCTNCGRKLDGEILQKEFVEPVNRVCSNCGSILDEKAKFCPNCGMKMDAE